MSKNDITGDEIRTKVGNNEAYSSGWDRIFNKNKLQKSIAEETALGYCIHEDRAILLQIEAAMIDNQVDKLSDILSQATRIGHEEDNPEGVRYIQITDTLAKEMVSTLAKIKRNINQELSTKDEYIKDLEVAFNWFVSIGLDYIPNDVYHNQGGRKLVANVEGEDV